MTTADGNKLTPDTVVARVIGHFMQLGVFWAGEEKRTPARLAIYCKTMRENLPPGIELIWTKDRPFSAKFTDGDFMYTIRDRDNGIITSRSRKR